MKRILHVLYTINRGGAETWLMHVLRNIDREQFHFDFLVHTDQPGDYEEEILQLGSSLLRVPHPSQLLIYGREARRLLREHGPYDVLHVHCPMSVGYLFHIAAQERISCRILHAHNQRGYGRGSFSARFYKFLTSPWTARYLTHGLACSPAAATAFFGPKWSEDPRYRILPCGLDFSPFHADVGRESIRAELGIPPGSPVLGHVGRFEPVKNHAYLLRVTKVLLAAMPDIHLVLVGDGPLRQSTEQLAAELGLDGHVTFTGLRDDVPRIMKGAFDVLLLPSLHEGLGLVLLEAQAAGIPCLCSDGVPREASVVPGLMSWLPLAQSPESWADKLAELLKTAEPIQPANALEMIEQSPYGIRRNIEELTSVYS